MKIYLLKASILLSCLLICSLQVVLAQKGSSPFRVAVLYENGGHHIAYSKAAKFWLDKLAADSGFTIDYIQNTDSIDDAFLALHKLFIQLDYPPYGWKDKAVLAFRRYITEGKGGWLGFHHATLLGEFDGFPVWQWFSAFMGNILFKNYIPTFATATVTTETSRHPVMQGVPRNFIIENEEWYTYNKSPRPEVQVIASVNESTYAPSSDIKMGDHPVIWTNLHFKARNMYIFMGHSPDLFNNKNYTTIFRNAIFWVAGKN